MNENILNLLYCLDSKYDIQALISINSFLKNYDKDLNLHFIHENSNSLKKYKEKILINKKVKDINFYDFNPHEKKIIDNLPLKIKHVSKATYFRLFLESYLKDDVKRLLYLDPDVITIRNTTSILEKKFKELNESNFTIGATNYLISDNSENRKLIKNLNMNSNLYFNAGVMLIDFEKWSKNNLKLKLLEEPSSKIIEFGDQDFLNSYFDGKFLELGFDFNYPIKESLYSKNQKNIEKSVYFIHYQGAEKPWTPSGLFRNSSVYYHNYYIFDNLKQYHIVFEDNEKLMSLLKKIGYKNFLKPKNLHKFLFLIKSFFNKIVR